MNSVICSRNSTKTLKPIELEQLRQDKKLKANRVCLSGYGWLLIFVLTRFTIGIEKVIEELQKQNAEQRELLNALSDSELKQTLTIVSSLSFSLFSLSSRLACGLYETTW